MYLVERANSTELVFVDKLFFDFFFSFFFFHSFFFVVCVCQLQPGHPDRSGQLCDQFVLRLPAVTHCCRSGRRVRARIRPEDEPQRLVRERVQCRAAADVDGRVFQPLFLLFALWLLRESLL